MTEKYQEQRERRYNPYRRVRTEGGSVVITMGAVIPKDWNMVEVKVLGEPTDKEVVIKFRKVS